MRLILALLLLFSLVLTTSAVVITTCQDLSTIGASYTFSQNITSTGGTCLNITAANISLDCGNFAINGNNGTGYAAINSTAFNSSVKNCTISSFDIGINTRGSFGSFVWNNITSTIWVDNNDTTNNFNTSNNSGNIFYFSNGSGAWNVLNLIALVPPLWATYGASLPINATTAGGNWSGVGSSWNAWTETGFAHPTVADLESNISQSTSSSVFTTIASANITPASANKTYKAVVTANFCTWSNQQGGVEYQLLINNVSYGNWPYTVAGNTCGDIAFLGGIFTSNGTQSFRVELQQRKTSGPTSWSANTTFSDTNIIGMRDLDSGINISYANFTYNTTFSNSTMTLLQTFSATLPRGQLVILASRHANVSVGGNVTTEINITDVAGNVYPCNINLTRTLTAGVNGTGNVLECIVPANLPAGQVNVSLYGMVSGGGQATIYGRLFEYSSYGITINESKSTPLNNFSTSSTTMVQVKNITVDVERPNQDEEVIATMSVKGTVPDSVIWCQVRATNSSGLPAPAPTTNVSEVENLTLPTANAYSLLTVQHSIINLTNDNYTIALWCNVSAGTMSIGGGTLAANIADNTLTTLNPNSPVIYIPENTTYNKSINDTMLMNYSNAKSEGGQNISQYKGDLFFSNGVFAGVIFANNSDNLTYLWNFSAVANGQYFVRITAIDVVGNTAIGESANFTIQATAIPIIAITYPTAGSAFGPNQCSFLTTANISFYSNSTGRSATAFLYLNGIAQNNTSMTINGSGLYSANFTTLTQSGNYSVIWVASDSYGAAVNQTTWAAYGAMAACVAAAADTDSNAWAFLSLILIGISLMMVPPLRGDVDGEKH